jgi:hypothetical protein
MSTTPGSQRWPRESWKSHLFIRHGDYIYRTLDAAGSEQLVEASRRGRGGPTSSIGECLGAAWASFGMQTDCGDVSLLQAGVPVGTCDPTQLDEIERNSARNLSPERECAKPAMHEKGKKRATPDITAAIARPSFVNQWHRDVLKRSRANSCYGPSGVTQGRLEDLRKREACSKQTVPRAVVH